MSRDDVLLWGDGRVCSGLMGLPGFLARLVKLKGLASVDSLLLLGVGS
jgi:hypothetical protein